MQPSGYALIRNLQVTRLSIAQTNLFSCAGSRLRGGTGVRDQSGDASAVVS
jgi:hypothetical protein